MAAKKDGLSVKITGDVEDLDKGFKVAQDIVKKGAKELEKQAGIMALKVRNSIANMTPKSQARKLEALTAEMMEMGMQGTQAFQMVTKAAAHFKATVDDAKGMIEAMRPDAPFNALSTTLQGSAQAFAGVQGAMALFGAESENVQKALLKVQGALALAEGVKAIDTLTDGFQQLTMVVKANPLMAGAVAFTAAAAAIAAITLNTDNLTESQRNYALATEKAYDATINEKVEIESLLSVYNDKNTTDEERLAIQKKLIELAPELLGGISKEGVETEKVNAAITGYIQLMEIKAKAQAYQELYVESLKEENKLQKDVNGALDKTVGFLEDITGLNQGGIFSAAERDLQRAQNNTAALKKSYQDLTKQALDLESAQKKAFGAATNPKAPASTSKKAAKVDTSSLERQQAILEKAAFLLKKKDIWDVSAKGISAAGSAVEDLTEKYKDFNQVQIDIPNKLEEGNAALRKHVEVMRSVQISAEEMTSAIQSAMTNAITSMAVALGEALATGQNVAEALGKTFLMAMGDFLKQFGQMLIAAGVAKIALDTGLTIPGGGVGAVAAGVALVAASAALSAHLSKGMKAQKFADGGIVQGTSYSGDRVHALVNSGEMILNKQQQSNLFGMINNGGGVGGFIASAKIDGRDLMLIVERAKKDMSR